MAELKLNKSELKTQNDKLKNYKKFLPSLELKRKQLMAERNKARIALQALRDRTGDVNDRLKDQYPMLAGTDLVLDGIVTVTDVEFTFENVVGVTLPKFDGMKVTQKTFDLLSTPIWLDCLAADLKKAIELQIEIRVAEKRLELLEVSLRRTTQRVNLFDKVLIPQTQENIRKIKIYLSDAERAGVVQAKIAKAKTLKKSEAAARANTETKNLAQAA